MEKKRIQAQAFQTDQLGIDQLKNEFFREARDFIYFRKGEWEGIVQSIDCAIKWVEANPDLTLITLALYPPAKDMVTAIMKVTGVSSQRVKKYFGRPDGSKNLVTARVICSETVDSSSIRKWEDICGKGSVVTIPQSQTGPFRYLVNEQRYAIFCRLGPNDLRGIIGQDKQTIAVLRYRFDQEFVEAAIKKSKRRNK